MIGIAKGPLCADPSTFDMQYRDTYICKCTNNVLFLMNSVQHFHLCCSHLSVHMDNVSEGKRVLLLNFHDLYIKERK